MRQQKVALNGKISSWLNVAAGASQSFGSGPVLFIIYINNLPDKITS